MEGLKGRFWSKVGRKSEDECWEWQASKQNKGYGIFRVDDSVELAHRVSYQLNDRDPEDQFVLHKCDNRSCVNPNHLFLGDQQDNINDAMEKDRMVIPDNKGENNSRAQFTQENIIEIRERANNETYQELADYYNVSSSTIGCIVRRESWKNVNP